MATDAKTGQAIYPGTPGVGLHNVGSYQASGTPWITGSFLTAEISSGSVMTCNFPRIAKKITVQVIPNVWATANGDGSTVNFSDPLMIFFGEPKTSAGTSKTGNNTFITNPFSPRYTADAHAPPLQYSQGHTYSVTYQSASLATGAPHLTAGNSFTTTVRTDHINIACVANPFTAVTASFQIFAELTNIPAARMPAGYISGSGVNTI
jgi:hypothetical protein